MLLTVLGSGSCELRADRSSPAYLLQAAGFSLLLDLGAGAWRRLTEAGLDPAQVGGVVLSHSHPDHLADLIPLLFALNYDPELARRASLDILGHRDLEPLVAGLQGLFGTWLTPPPERLRARWLAPGRSLDLGPLTIHTAAADHAPTSLAWRVEAEGQSLVYLGDSRATPELARFSRGAGLIIAHCAGSDQKPKPGHLHPRAAGELARRAGAGGLLLSHFYREVDPDLAVASAAEAFGGPVWAARDLGRWRLAAGGPRPDGDA
jgi:ribonuclease BN (tRNA processing enzyme)